MIKFYPSFNNIFENFHGLAGNQTGIMKSTVMPLVNFNDGVCLKSITGNMPNYHKQLIDNPNMDVQYHIIGYGTYYEEALIKYTGESIERYSTMVAPKLVEEDIFYASYKEVSKLGKTMPIKYMDVFTKDQIKQSFEYGMDIHSEKITEDDVIGWIKCASLFNPKENIWVPAKMMFVGYQSNIKKSEKSFIPSFSTGTAAHKSLKKSLINALVEYIQIDAFIINWYTKRKCPLVKIDDENVKRVLESVKLDENSPYEIIPMYNTLPELPLPIFGVFLKRKDKKMPYLVYGVQGDFDTKNGMVRAIMEAAAISYGGYYSAIYSREKLKYVLGDDPKFLDLDMNVLYYSASDKMEEKDELIDSLIEGEILLSKINTIEDLSEDSQLNHLIKYLSKLSEYAVYMDVTPPEAREKGWYVSRVLIPEILEMCIPEFPFANHPRILEYGGVKNEYPHPMP